MATLRRLSLAGHGGEGVWLEPRRNKRNSFKSSIKRVIVSKIDSDGLEETLKKKAQKKKGKVGRFRR